MHRLFLPIIMLLLPLLISANSNEFQKVKNSNKEFTKCSTILYDKILLVHNTIIRKDIYNEKVINRKEPSLNYSHFLINLTSTINLNQIYPNANLKNNYIDSNFDIFFFTYKNNLNAMATLDKFHSNNKFNNTTDSLLSLYTISLKKKLWIVKNSKSEYHIDNYSGSSITSVKDSLFVYGGWQLNLDTNISTIVNNLTVLNLDYTNSLHPTAEIDSSMPPSAFHTATMINSTTMVILGGLSYENSDSEKPKIEIIPKGQNYSKESIMMNLKHIHMYNTDLRLYKKIETKNYNDRIRIGHSATHLYDLNCILVYGGTDKVNDYTTLYSDIQLLNLTNWQWTKIDIIDFDNMIFDIGRAWHSSELINDKVVFFYGDINNSDSQYDIIAIDLKTLDLEKKTIKLSNTIGPATKKENEDFDQLYTSDEAMNYYVDPYKLKLTHYLNTSDIAGIIIGVILFTIILITLCYYFTNRYKKWKWYKKCNMLGSNPPSTFLSSLNLSLPNTKNGDEYGIWDLDSHYANSIHSLENELSHFNEPVILFRCNNSLPLSTRSTKINSSEETTASNIDSITDDTIINATSGF